MRKIQITLILIATLWNVLPTDSPFRPLFDLLQGGESTSGDVTIHQDPPDTDPGGIIIPPP
jgi:hypothetical protein